MTLILMITISLTVAAGVLLLLSRDLFRTLVGLAVLGSAVNLTVFLAGRPGSLTPPLIPPGLDRLPAGAADPLPQALVLTAIVIGFAMTALFLVVLLASRGISGTDHVDGSHSRDVQEMP